MVQSPSWAANRFAASQEIPRISRNPKVHYRTHKRPPPVNTNTIVINIIFVLTGSELCFTINRYYYCWNCFSPVNLVKPFRMLCHVNQVSKKFETKSTSDYLDCVFFFFLASTIHFEVLLYCSTATDSSCFVLRVVFTFPLLLYTGRRIFQKLGKMSPTEGWPNSSWVRIQKRLTTGWSIKSTDLTAHGTYRLPWYRFYIVFLVARQVPGCQKKTEHCSPTPHVVAVLTSLTELLWVQNLRLIQQSFYLPLERTYCNS